jgi:hypothetical protein
MSGEARVYDSNIIYFRVKLLTEDPFIDVSEVLTVSIIRAMIHYCLRKAGQRG